MIALILALLTTQASLDLPPALVEVGEPEAIWVPAGLLGTIIATPAAPGEIAFETAGG